MDRWMNRLNVAKRRKEKKGNEKAKRKQYIVMCKTVMSAERNEGRKEQ